MRRGAVYRVGTQRFAGRAKARFSFGEQPMLTIEGAADVRIAGNGAIIRLNDGLRYGGFDPASGQRMQRRTVEQNYAATIGCLIDIRNCKSVTVESLTLDGNSSRLVIGGPSGDTGIQRPAIGVRIWNSRDVTLRNVTARDNGLDGFYIRATNRSRSGGAFDNIHFVDCVADRNGRQGLSIVGGRRMTFIRCVFRNTGQGSLSSAPGAGVDIEPNGTDWASETSFTGCIFENNHGVGLLADSGNSHTLKVRDCTFWQGFAAKKGITRGSGDALWLGREGVTIADSQINGAITHLPMSAVISNCRFSNQPRGNFGPTATNRKFMLERPGGTFQGCTFTITGNGGSGLIYAGWDYRNCRFIVDTNTFRGIAYVALLGKETALADCEFTHTSAMQKPMFVKYDGGCLCGRIVVSGTRLHWASLKGSTGVIHARGCEARPKGTKRIVACASPI